MSKIELGAWEHTDSCKREGRGGNWLKEGEGISQRTCMNNSWPWTTLCGLTESGRQAGWRGAKGENWDKCNSINNKIFK